MVYLIEAYEIWTAKSIIVIEASTEEEAKQLFEDGKGDEVYHTTPAYLETNHSEIIEKYPTMGEVINIYKHTTENN